MTEVISERAASHTSTYNGINSYHNTAAECSALHVCFFTGKFACPGVWYTVNCSTVIAELTENDAHRDQRAHVSPSLTQISPWCYAGRWSLLPVVLSLIHIHPHFETATRADCRNRAPQQTTSYKHNATNTTTTVNLTFPSHALAIRVLRCFDSLAFCCLCCSSSATCFLCVRSNHSNA